MFKVGDIVEHSELGTGEVIKLYGINKAAILFDRYGYRKTETYVDVEYLKPFDIHQLIEL